MTKKIRVGIIGVNADRGWASMAHIPAIKALPEFELTAFSNHNLQLYNVAENYSRIASDLQNGTTLCATCDDAVVRHRMLYAIEKAAASGQRQSYLTTETA